MNQAIQTTEHVPPDDEPTWKHTNKFENKEEKEKIIL